MELRKSFRTSLDRDAAVEKLCNDETLESLLPGDTEIVEREGDRRTTRTRYSALGREGVATFDFEYLMDGNVRFAKRCDGKIWRRLEGRGGPHARHQAPTDRGGARARRIEAAGAREAARIAGLTAASGGASLGSSPQGGSRSASPGGGGRSGGAGARRCPPTRPPPR